MPAEPAYAESLRTTIGFVLPNGDVAENVLHWSISPGATIDAAFASAMADAVFNPWNTNLRPLTATGVQFNRVIVQDLRTTPYPTWLETADNAFGADASGAMPFQAAIVASLHTTRAGRSGRGRVFLPGFTKSSLHGDGTIETATITAVLAWANALAAITVVDTQEVEWEVLSRKLGTGAPVTSITVDNRWDVQRRRANRRLF